MLRLSAFADEIDPDIDVQIEHCLRNGVTHLELRGAAGLNVLDFGKDLCREIKARLDDHGMGVAAIGSPIGKVRLDESFDRHFDSFKRAVELGGFFEAPLIRIFSYYPAEGSSHEELVETSREEVIRRIRRKAEYVEDTNVVLVHENERGIYGERCEQCLDMLRTVDAPRFRAAFDFANFVQAGEDPLENWPLLKPHTAHIHVKDALADSGRVVPAGEGDGHIAEILKDAYEGGYRGFLSLEPHLAVAGKSSGFTGPELFETAVDALRRVAAEVEVPLAE
jgi:sugar phosphate isomerase/epimerase